jgi:hypothetical protein
MSKKNKSGRPPRFKTVSELDDLIDAYFEHCEAKEKPALIVGFQNFAELRESTYHDYRKKPEFSESFSRLKKKAEESLLLGGLTGEYNASITRLIASHNFGITETTNQNINAEVKVTKGLDAYYEDVDEA